MKKLLLFLLLIPSVCFAVDFSELETIINYDTGKTDYINKLSGISSDISTTGTVTGAIVVATNYVSAPIVYQNGSPLSDLYLTLAASNQTVTQVPNFSNGLTAGTLSLSSGSITDSSGAISLGDENVSFTGTLGAGATTLSSLTVDSNIVNLSDTTDEYVLAFDTATQTWRGVAGGGGGGYTNLTSFVDQTNWRLFYSDGSGDVKELAFGDATKILTSNGASAAPTWEAGDAGDITSVGDVAAGAAFDGTQGTTLTFFNAGGNATLAYNGTTLTSSKYITGNLTGNVTGNASGSSGSCTGQAATVATITSLAPDTATTQATQPNITSLGTLTTLTVDDITINGNTISSAGASTLAITPAAGQTITFDGTVTLDAGVIAGATSITSTGFTGALTGKADTAGVADSATGNAGTVTNGVYTSGNQSIAGIKTFSDATEASNATTGGTVVSGGLAVAKRVYATDMTVTNKITGSISGNADGSSGTCTGNAGSATYASAVTIVNEVTDTTCFPVFATTATGNIALSTGGGLSLNSNTGALTATTFVGALTGDASGSSGSCTGNAATVTTNANLTGEVTSVGNATTIADSIAVTNWNLTTPTITTSATMTDGATIGQAAGPLVAFDDTNNYLEITGCKVGIGVTSPTAVLHLKAGTATAGTAPLKLTSGALLTTAEAGAVEYLTDTFYIRGTDKLNVAGGITTAGALGAGAITGTSFIIGANTLDTAEWANLDGQDQAVKTTDVPQFSAINLVRADPYYRLSPTAGDAFEWYAYGSELYLTNYTDGAILIRVKQDNTMVLPAKVESKSFMITNPTATADKPVWRTLRAITIRAVHLLCIGGTNIIGHLDKMDENGLNAAGIDGATDITSTASVNANDDGTLSNPSIGAGNYVGWHTTSISGTPTNAVITFEYTEDNQ